MPDTNLEGDHPRIISAKFGLDWLSSFRWEFFFQFHSPFFYFIEISSNGQNCSILSQKVPKFELYKHNNELVNIYYSSFYELWTFAYFDRLCKAILIEGPNRGHIFGREPSNDYFIKMFFLLSKWFQTRRFLWEFRIGSYVKLSSAEAPRWPPLLKI
jgi:hypothetical protein